MGGTAAAEMQPPLSLPPGRAANRSIRFPSLSDPAYLAFDAKNTCDPSAEIVANTLPCSPAPNWGLMIPTAPLVHS